MVGSQRRERVVLLGLMVIRIGSEKVGRVGSSILSERITKCVLEKAFSSLSFEGRYLYVRFISAKAPN